MGKFFDEKKRINRVLEALKEERVDALLVTDLTNIRYISGFTGTEASALITPEAFFLLVDSRYTTQAKQEAPFFQIIKVTKRIEDTIKLIKRLKMRKIGFEGTAMYYTDFCEIAKNLSEGGFIPIKKRLDFIRMRKEKEEIEIIRRAIEISTQGFQAMKCELKIGVREKHIAHTYEIEAKKNGADKIAFDIIVASGKRSALPHGVASNKKIGKRELVVMDFGIQYRGYNTDETCTLVCGKPTPKQKEFFAVVKSAHDRAISQIRPGVSSRLVDKAARDYIAKKGLGKYFGHGTGHGVGLSVHEEPWISPLKEEVLEEGMVFTIEPGVYVPNWGGIRVEDMVLVTRDGCEILTQLPKNLEIINQEA
ncbi:MAG: Xaa-Pro peptidase family protein [Desulfobacterota bacterium]|nr:Xaa-Pro peptidase family protein [Thermodesulfobacteriota bacterium]